MSQVLWYALVGVGLFLMGLLGLILYRHLLRRVLALHIMGAGVFLIFVALARRAGALPDPVPHAMVITGIVVAVSASALALILMLKMTTETGKAELPDEAGE